MFFQSALALTLASAALARPGLLRGGSYLPPAPSSHSSHSSHSSQGYNDYGPLMPFDFAYAVEDAPSSNSYSHRARQDESAVTGQYRVLLPDCRTQIVSYTADREHGYRAEVSYEGQPCEGPSSDHTHQQPSRPGYSYEPPSIGYSK